MRTFASLLFGTTMIALALSGCLVGADEAYHVYATNGRFVSGFGYDGAGITKFEGDAYLDVSEAANTGVFVAEGKVGPTKYRIVFEDFAASKPFHDGGLAGDFKEHGASGVGDRTIPEVDLEMAGWGVASLSTDAGAMKDPISGKDMWTAHFMVIRNGVRDDASGQIHDVDHKPYDPANADKGMSTPGDYELHVVVRNQTANGTPGAQAIGPITNNQANPTASRTDKLFTSNAVGAQATVDISVTGTGVSGSNLTFTILAPSGNTVLTRAVGAGPGPVSASGTASAQLKFPVGELGDYQVRATGRIAPGGGYSVRGSVAPPPSIVLNFWWEDLVFGEEAAMKGEAGSMLEGTKFHNADGHSHDMSPSASATLAPRKIR